MKCGNVRKVSSCSWINWNGMRNWFLHFFANKSKFLWRTEKMYEIRMTSPYHLLKSRKIKNLKNLTFFNRKIRTKYFVSCLIIIHWEQEARNWYDTWRHERKVIKNKACTSLVLHCEKENQHFIKEVTWNTSPFIFIQANFNLDKLHCN